MSTAEATTPPEGRPGHADGARPPQSVSISLKPSDADEVAVAEARGAAHPGVNEPDRETFIPVTRFALMDRLTAPQAWPNSIATDARRFFQYLDYWRHQRYA